MKAFLASLQTVSGQESLEERYMKGRPYTFPVGREDPMD